MIAKEANDRGGLTTTTTTAIIMMASPTSVTSVPTAAVDADKNDETAIVMEPMTLPPTSHSCRPWPALPASKKSQRTTNPIRSIVDPIFSNIASGAERGDGKDPISLAVRGRHFDQNALRSLFVQLTNIFCIVAPSFTQLGDPTAAGNLPPCPVAIEAIQRTLLHAPHAAGYVPAVGLASAREAIAAYHSTDRLRVSSERVVVASGCSGALELALTAMLDEDSVLLVPRPGFPLYQVIAESHGASTLEYRLDPNQRWQVDLHHLELLLRSHPSRGKIRGLVVNNPSNPAGVVYRRHHLREIVLLCQRYQVPIVADEVYGNLTHAGHEFVSLAEVAHEMGSHVPVVVASGMGKQFLLPGWRVGWVVFFDNAHGSLGPVEAGAKRLAQVVLGASHLAQMAVPALLDKSSTVVRDWKLQLCRTLEDQANLVCRALSGAPGLHLCPFAGAMYIMIRLDLDRFRTIADDVAFCSLLLREENVVLLPGSCFGAPGYVRIVYCAPPAVLSEAAARMTAFCGRHVK